MYEDSTAVLGPLSRLSEPHAYDLCQEHASRMTAPRGWELLRVAGAAGASDDLVALADAVRPRTGGASPSPAPTSAGTSSADGATGARAPRHSRETPGRHLHVVRSTHE